MYVFRLQLRSPENFEKSMCHGEEKNHSSTLRARFFGGSKEKLHRDNFSPYINKDEDTFIVIKR